MSKRTNPFYTESQESKNSPRLVLDKFSNL